MPITINRTLPNEWDETKTYYEGDTVIWLNIIYRCLQTSVNNPPDISTDYWKALDIYTKDASVMDDENSGDAEFWQRDRIYIDTAGFVYVNNENTGINVRGRDGQTTISFDELTPEQLEQIRGPRGYIGPQGIQGETGPQGPMGEVTLTPEQVEALKGDEGKSAYDIWLEQGYSGTEADFVAWLRSGIITLDKELDNTSANGVENRAITQGFQSYKNNITTLVNQLQSRVEDLENRLKYKYQGTDYFFKFGITTEGKWGYFYNNENIIIPFDKSDDSTNLTSSQAEINDGAFTYELGQSSLIIPSNTINPNNVIYSTNATVDRFEDFFNTYVYIYKDGTVFNAEFDLGYYNMILTPSTPYFGSKGLVAGEGVIFSPINVSDTASVIRFKVRPVGYETVYYQVGTFTNNEAALPSLITEGTYRSRYSNGSFEDETLITYSVRPGEGVYFGTTSAAEFEILEIYLD